MPQDPKPDEKDKKATPGTQAQAGVEVEENPFIYHLPTGAVQVTGGASPLETIINGIPTLEPNVTRTILESPNTGIVNTHGDGGPGNFTFSLDKKFAEVGFTPNQEEVWDALRKQNPEIVFITSCNGEGGLSPELVEKKLGANSRVKMVVMPPPGQLGVAPNPNDDTPQSRAWAGDSLTPGVYMKGPQQEYLNESGAKSGPLHVYYKNDQTGKWEDGGEWQWDKKFVDESIYRATGQDNAKEVAHIGQDGKNYMMQRILCSPLSAPDRADRLKAWGKDGIEGRLTIARGDEANACRDVDMSVQGLVKVYQGAHDSEEALWQNWRPGKKPNIGQVEHKYGVSINDDGGMVVPSKLYNEFLNAMAKKEVRPGAKLNEQAQTLYEQSIGRGQKRLPEDQGGYKIIKDWERGKWSEEQIFEKWLMEREARQQQEQKQKSQGGQENNHAQAETPEHYPSGNPAQRPVARIDARQEKPAQAPAPQQELQRQAA